MKNTIFPSINSNYMISKPRAEKKKGQFGVFFFGRALEGRTRGVLKHHFRVVRG